MKESVLGIYLLAVISILTIAIYGIYLAFSASIILGIVVVFIEPSPFLLGIAAILGHPEMAQTITSWLGLPI